jgi:hypothetical protein
VDPALHGAALLRLDAESAAPGWQAGGRVDGRGVELPPYAVVRIEGPPGPDVRTPANPSLA